MGRVDSALGRVTSFMTAEQAGEFVDADVLVYAFDASAGTKRAAAVGLLDRLWSQGNGCLSVQVLQEFFAAVTSKVSQPMPVEEASERIRELALWNVYSPAAADVLAAVDLHRRLQLSFWDAMIVQAASESRCSVLWTEDLNDGQVLRGVRVRNPFKATGKP